MADNELLIKINADAQNVKKAFEDVKGQTSDLEGSLNNIALVAGASFAALTAEIGFSVAAYKEAEDAAKSLTAVLQNQGIFTEQLRDSYKSYADEIERTTGLDGDAITKAQAVAQGYLGQTKITQDLTKAIADLSVAKGVDLSTAATLLAKTIGTSTNALAREGLQLSDTATKAEKYAAVLKFVEGRYGGQADAAAKGLGALNQLKTAFGNLQEAIGERFAPIVASGAKALADFIQKVANNKPLIDFIVSLIAGATAVTGIITVLAIAGKVFLGFQAALAAAGVAISGVRIALLLLTGATGIGLLVTALTFVALNWNTVWPRMQAIFQAFVDNIVQLASGLKEILLGVFTLDSSRIAAGLEEIKSAYKKGAEEAFKELPKAAEKAEEEQNAVQKKAADKREADRNAAENRRLARINAENELIKLQLEKASDAAIEIKKREIEILKALEGDTSATKRELLNQQLEETRAKEDEIQAQDIERKRAFAEEKAAVDAELREQGIIIEDAARAEELRKSQEALLTDQQVNQKIAKETLDDRIQKRNLELEDRKRYGVAVATINAALRSDEVQGAKTVSGELVQLAQSKNSTLKKIGQAAAIAQITIATAESAVTIAQQVIRVIPFPFNIPIAAGLAAARIAFGAEQISNVRGAQDGALVEGPGRGDSVPFLLEPGELVTPRKNFEEVVGGVQSQRNNKDDEILATLQDIAAKPSGSTVVVQGDVLAEDTYIDRLMTKISDAFEFRNAKVFGVNT